MLVRECDLCKKTIFQLMISRGRKKGRSLMQ